MDKEMNNLWVVEFKAFNDNNWTAVNGIKYTNKATALATLGKEIAADPEYTHRLVRLERTVETVVEGTGEYKE